MNIEKTKDLFGPFVINGILFSTLDFEIKNLSILDQDGNRKSWVTVSQVIEKGGYVWYIGRAGIYLKKNGQSRLIALKEPIKNISFADNTIIKPRFSVLPEKGAGFLIEVPGNVIQIK